MSAKNCPATNEARVAPYGDKASMIRQSAIRPPPSQQLLPRQPLQVRNFCPHRLEMRRRDLLEWRLVKGTPKAAILRIWRVDTGSDRVSRQFENLIVLKISRNVSCMVEVVDGRQAEAIVSAR